MFFKHTQRIFNAILLTRINKVNHYNYSHFLDFFCYKLKIRWEVYVSPHPLLIANCLFGVPCSIFSHYTRHHWTGYQPVRLCLLSPTFTQLNSHWVWPDLQTNHSNKQKIKIFDCLCPGNWGQCGDPVFLVRRRDERVCWLLSRAGCGAGWLLVLLFVCTTPLLYNTVHHCTTHFCTLSSLYLPPSPISIPRHPT